MPYVADRKIDRCLDCGSCRELVLCPGGGDGCIGCGACAPVSNSTSKVGHNHPGTPVEVEVEKVK